MKENKIKIILIIVVIVICAAVYGSVTYIYKNKKEKVNNNPLYTKENFPKIDASLATQPLTNAIYKNFTGVEEFDEKVLNYSNTHPAYVKLINDEVDLIVVTEPSKEELALAKEKGVELEVIPVVKEGFVFYVNAKNKIDNLTTTEIQDIYSGKIKNWKSLGGENKNIIAYQRPVNSGSQTGMLSLVMKDKKIMDAPKENLVSSMEDIINLVSSYKNGLDAIGYSYYYYATTMFQTIDESVANNIKLLAIDGITPNNETIKNGTYPFTTAYYIVINKNDDENSASRKLASELLSKRGQKVAEEAGYVPVK